LPFISTSQVAWNTDECHNAPACWDRVSLTFARADLKQLYSCICAGITGICHHAQLRGI
jgi:hypothetical protein